MDYEELITYFRQQANYHQFLADADFTNRKNFEFIKDICVKAAYAIETLLEDRDEMIKDLRHGGCKVCTFASFAYSDEPCCKCKETGSTTDKWEWRGVTKEREK